MAHRENKKMMKAVRQCYRSQMSVVCISDNVAPEEVLHPFVLVGNSVFKKSDFLYGLSKGVVLMSLSETKFQGHGGVFESPYLAWRHDIGHFLTLCGINLERSAITKQICFLKQLSKDILDLTKCKDRTLSILPISVGFDLIHEINLDSIFSYPKMTYKEGVKALLEVASLTDMGFNEFSRYGDQGDFAFRFLSDLPKDLIRRNKTLQDVINYKSVTEYNWDQTLTEIKKEFRLLEKELAL